MPPKSRILTRRAQFLIEHPWFVEGGEELPVHKDSPKMGGDYPFRMTTGHNRWSIHAMNMANRHLLNTHHGWDPFMFEGWNGPNEVEPGMVKWLGLAGGYGHLKYAPMKWQPVPIDRFVHVNVEKA